MREDGEAVYFTLDTLNTAAVCLSVLGNGAYSAAGQGCGLDLARAQANEVAGVRQDGRGGALTRGA